VRGKGVAGLALWEKRAVYWHYAGLLILHSTGSMSCSCAAWRLSHVSLAHVDTCRLLSPSLCLLRYLAIWL
jgi:hypothetical protein